MQPGEWGELAGDSVADRGDAAAVEDGAVEDSAADGAAEDSAADGATEDSAADGAADGSAPDGVDATAVERGEGDEATTEPDRRDDSDSPGVVAFYRGP